MNASVDPTRRAVLRSARERLEAAGIPSARREATLLLAHALHEEPHRLSLDPEASVVPDVARELERLLLARETRRPLAQVLGSVEFWSLRFEVTNDVLCPRPETEHLVEEAIRFLQGSRSAVVVDVGTGSGCIAVAVAAEVGTAVVHAVDISPAALAVARRNVSRHGLTGRVHLHQGDLLDPLVHDVAPGSVDLVLSNPPYVRRAEAGRVDPEVLHDPALAVFGEGDPVALYRRIGEGAAGVLRAGGMLLLELPGEGDAAFVEAALSCGAYEDGDVVPDLAGLPRVLRTRRRART